MDNSSLVFVLAAAALIFLIGQVFAQRGRKLILSEVWMLLLGVVAFPSLVLYAGFNAAMEKSKTVEFCGTSCHVMHPYYEDLTNPDSTNLAAIHFQNRYIRTNQCYQCHSSYTMFGPMQAKIAGVLHVLNYYSGNWEEPLKLRGEYKNANCLHCHGDAKNYLDLHEDYVEELASGDSSCLECHSDIHPRPQSAHAISQEKRG